jgi:hypothetical protein
MLGCCRRSNQRRQRQREQVPAKQPAIAIRRSGRSRALHYVLPRKICAHPREPVAKPLAL